jgi:hypothetical protein
MSRAAGHYRAARGEAEQHGVRGEAATAQSMRAFVLAFTDPDRADDEIDLAQRLLQHVGMRASGINASLAALARDAGQATDLEARAQAGLAEIRAAGLAPTQAAVHLVLSFHHAVLENSSDLDVAIARLRELTRGGDYTYYVDIAHFMADLPLPANYGSRARWIEGEAATRARWRALITARRDRLRPSR